MDLGASRLAEHFMHLVDSGSCSASCADNMAALGVAKGASQWMTTTAGWPPGGDPAVVDVIHCHPLRHLLRRRARPCCRRITQDMILTQPGARSAEPSGLLLGPWNFRSLAVRITPLVLGEARAVSYTHLTLPTKRIV